MSLSDRWLSLAILSKIKSVLDMLCRVFSAVYWDDSSLPLIACLQLRSSMRSKEPNKNPSQFKEFRDSWISQATRRFELGEVKWGFASSNWNFRYRAIPLAFASPPWIWRTACELFSWTMNIRVAWNSNKCCQSAPWQLYMIVRRREAGFRFSHHVYQGRYKLIQFYTNLESIIENWVERDTLCIRNGKIFPLPQSNILRKDDVIV